MGCGEGLGGDAIGDTIKAEAKSLCLLVKFTILAAITAFNLNFIR